ncbi:MAG: SOUL family heme-binding protein [Akkermansiaceae bacterium]|jgi:DNA gyrase inhibitor GyrI|nr:heme-binding protein [Luteolibacter sp.]
MKALFALLIATLTSCAIEKPTYESVQKKGDFEVRKYAAIPIVSAPMQDMEKRDNSFRQLFKYISGENDKKQKISMTSPVFVNEAADSKKSGSMSFMIPSEVAKMGSPTPNAEGLAVAKIDGGSYAVLRFSGWDKEDNRKAASESLAKLIVENKLNPTGKPFFAFYDPPWIPEMLRQNEVWQMLEP